MPDLSFQVQGVEPLAYAAAPTLVFKLQVIEEAGAGEPAAPIHSVNLCCQIRLEPARRRYSAGEQARLIDLFGEPQRWGQTVRSMLWSHASVAVPPFTSRTTVDLLVPCTYDFNIAATKYFDALEDGLVPLCFLFSGTIFYSAPDGALQVSQISWEKEANFSLPAPTWRRMMELYYPNSAWLCLRKDVFERLSRCKSARGFATWEAALESLLDASEEPVAP